MTTPRQPPPAPTFEDRVRERAYFHFRNSTGGKVASPIADWTTAEQEERAEDRTRIFDMARNGLFTLRLLATLERARKGEASLQKLVSDEAQDFGMGPDVPLLNQSAYAAALYISVVWLWDQPGVRGISQLEEKLGRRSRPPLAAARIIKNTLPRILTNVSIVDAIRNSCAHGTLEETETEFVFTNIDPRNRSDTLQFGLSWSDTAAVGESLFWILNDERWWKAPVHKVRRRKS